MKFFITVSIFIVLGISLLLYSGCGDDGTNVLSVNPGSDSNLNPAYPLQDQNFQILTDKEISSGQGMTSRRLDYIAKCINTTTLDPSSDITDNGLAFEFLEIGDMLYSISKDLQVEADLENIDEEIQDLGAEIEELNQKLNELSSQLALTQVNIQTYISSLNVQNYITPIKTAYSTTSEVGLVYYSNQAVLNYNNSPDAVPLSTLQTQEQVYIADVTSQTGMALQIQGIHDSICPDLNSLNGVLKDYTNKVILDSNQNGNNQNVKDPDNVMATYLLLESFYAQLLTYQFQGATILANAYNCQDPTGNQTKSYINGTFKNLLEDEMEKYLDTVNYMVVNLVDYRDVDTYAHDMGYSMQGLAEDDVYLDILTRSRFFCAQIMQAYDDDFGLYGAIVVPYDYTDGQNITLEFQGPSNFNTTITSQQIEGIYPYTKWTDSSGTAVPDNQWLFYEMPVNTDAPGGSYIVFFADNNSLTEPWPHTTPQLGNVSVKYYDPNNPDPTTATTSPTETNTLKFGYFSLKWPWGFQRMCSSNISSWVIPSKSSYTFPDGSHNNSEHNPASDNLKSCTFSPLSTETGFISAMEITQPSQKISTTVLKYVINIPVIPAGAPGDSSTASAGIIYYNIANIQTSASESKASTSTQYNFLFNDTTKDKTEKIVTYNSSSHSVNLYTTNKGFTDFTIYKGSKCNVSIDESYFTGAYKSCTSSANMAVGWHMQLIYNNTYNIFQ